LKSATKTVSDVSIAKTAILHDDVEIGDRSKVLDYVILREGTRIGKTTSLNSINK
jgi:UDP-3-O-[3-hydroxymyristoyl] glucosamine N-acyltransferase